MGSKHTAAGARVVGSIHHSSMAAWARSKRRASSMAQHFGCSDVVASAVDDAKCQRRRMGVMGSTEPAESAKSASLGSGKYGATTRKRWIQQLRTTPAIEFHDSSQAS